MKETLIFLRKSSCIIDFNSYFIFLIMTYQHALELNFPFQTECFKLLGPVKKDKLNDF